MPRAAPLPCRISRLFQAQRFRRQGVPAVSRQDQGQGRALQWLPASFLLCAADQPPQPERPEARCRHGQRQEVPNVRQHGTTGERPPERLKQEVKHLQAVPAPWRANIRAARPQDAPVAAPATARPAIALARIDEPAPAQHPLEVYQQLMGQVAQGVAAICSTNASFGEQDPGNLFCHSGPCQPCWSSTSTYLIN